MYCFTKWSSIVKRAALHLNNLNAYILCDYWICLELKETIIKKILNSLRAFRGFENFSVKNGKFIIEKFRAYFQSWNEKAPCTSFGNHNTHNHNHNCLITLHTHISNFNWCYSLKMLPTITSNEMKCIAFSWDNPIYCL